MIVPMVRVTLVALHGEREETLARLQDLGLLDLAAPGDGEDEGVDARRRELAAVRGAAAALERLVSKAAAAGGEPVAAGLAPEAVVAEVAAGLARAREREAELRACRAELARLAPLGAFDPGAVAALARRGLALRLFVALARRRLTAPEGASLHELARARGRRYLALVGRTPAPAELPGAEPFPLPSASTAELEGRIAELERERQAERRRLAALAAALPELRALELRGRDRLLLDEARAALGTSGPFVHLEGYCPGRDLPRLEAEAEARGWGLGVSPIEDPAGAPTFVEPPRWARPIGALFHLIGVLPAYDQMDVSVPFLAFFSLFFAMIVGDAGYGAIFLVLTLLERRLLRRAPRRLFRLLLLLSLATIAWGVATGDVFGVRKLPPMLELLRLDWLTHPEHLIPLAFLIGAVQLSLAHAWNVMRLWGSLRALAQLGWVLVIWTMYFLARTLVMATPFPRAMIPVALAGVVLVALFMTPWRRLGREWFQHAMLPLNLVSAFVDVVSYVRLFAVGAASYAVAAAFNSMALSNGVKGPLAAAVAALILFLGHALNIALGSLGVLVHGVRLNTLEFAGHLGLEWTGRPYRPFAHPGAARPPV